LPGIGRILLAAAVLTLAASPNMGAAQFLPGIIKQHPAHPSKSPSPSPSPSPSASASASASASPLPTPTETPAPAATSSPAPNPRATHAAPAGQQPTIPQSQTDPRILSIIAHPIAELSRFAWIAGTWRAHNVMELPGGRSRDLGLNTYVFAQTMKGRWIFGADGKAQDELYLTFDPFAKRYVLLRLEGNPSYGLWLSDGGWQGNKIVFLSAAAYANGREYRRRLTIIRKDASTFAIYNEEQLPNGVWTADDAVELTRQP
jgi:hypothetical protein